MNAPEQEREHPPVLRQAHEDDWAWRRAIRARRGLLVAYRVVVFVVGAALVIGGLIMVPLPGPGWLVVLLGLAVLASEFEPAQRVLDFAKVRLRRWETWVRAQPRIVQLFFALLTAAFVAGVVWGTLRISGVPPWLPDSIEDFLVDYGKLPRVHP